MHDNLYISNKVSVFETKISLIRFIFLTGINIRNTSYRPLIKGQYDSLWLPDAHLCFDVYLCLFATCCVSLWLIVLLSALLWPVVAHCSFLLFLQAHLESLWLIAVVATRFNCRWFIWSHWLTVAPCKFLLLVANCGFLWLVATYSDSFYGSF